MSFLAPHTSCSIIDVVTSKATRFDSTKLTSYFDNNPTSTDEMLYQLDKMPCDGLARSWDAFSQAGALDNTCCSEMSMIFQSMSLCCMI